MFIVHFEGWTGGQHYFMRGTSWTCRSRAQEFATAGDALAAFDKAKKFMRAMDRKRVRVVAADLMPVDTTSKTGMY